MHLFHVALLAVDETAIVCVTVGHQCHPRSVQCMFSVASVCGWLLTLTLEPSDIGLSLWIFYWRQIWSTAWRSSKMAAFRCIAAHGLRLNPLDCRGNYSATSNDMKSVHWSLMVGLLYSNTVIGTLAVDGWAVTYGTARRGLGGAAARPGSSSLVITVRCSAVLMYP